CAVLFILRVLGAIFSAANKILDARYTEAENQKTRKYLDEIWTGGPHPDWDYARGHTDPAYAAYVESYMQRQKLRYITDPDNPDGANIIAPRVTPPTFQ